ncbi:hypothetical protein Bbelb_365530 [Branchiostoma belcheri]|nr:hypothetical protein Bbelb_365530 [Branchiostoma belcheri]
MEHLETRAVRVNESGPYRKVRAVPSGTPVSNEFDVDEIKRLVSQFDSVVTKIYSNMEKGINALKDAITGDPDIIGMFEDLGTVIEQLPEKLPGEVLIYCESQEFCLADLCYWLPPNSEAFELRDAVENSLHTLGQFDPADWPEPAQPIIQMVMGVINTYQQIKSDILGFYNAVNMGIRVDLPWAAEQIWGAITTMIEALNDVFSNPKGALSDIFKSVFSGSTGFCAPLCYSFVAFATSIVCSTDFAPNPHRLGRPDHLELGPHWLPPPA